MILLCSETAKVPIFDISEPKKYLVGRKNCDILITDDQSISRQHAFIYVIDNEQVFLEDCKSRYKTAVNQKEVEPNKKIKLKNKDLVKFGALQSVYTLETVKYVVACSGLSTNQKEELQNELSECHTKYVEQWSVYCTHLTVEKISLTVKVLQAIVDGKPIVTPKYWEDLKVCLKRGRSEPAPENYKPPLAETLLNKFDLSSKIHRKKLFENKVFVFLNDDDNEQFGPVITSCGGESISWQTNKLTIYEIKVSSKEHLIIYSEEIDNDPSLKSVVSELQKDGKRMIPLQEIGLAILEGSCEQDCNSSFNRVKQVFSNKTVIATQAKTLVKETQSQFSEIRPLKMEVVPPSVEEDLEDVVMREKENTVQNKGSGKRIQPEEAAMSQNKRFKVENESEEFSTSTQKETSKEKNTTLTFFSKKRTADNPTDTASKKRSAEDPIESAAKKPAAKPNPFASMGPSTSKAPEPISSTNPFAQFRRPAESRPNPQSLKQNPFADMVLRGSKSKNNANVSIGDPFKQFTNNRTGTSSEDASQNTRNVGRDNIFHSTLINETISGLPKTSKVHNQSVTWLSKSIADVSPMKKDLDPEYERVVELFSNCVRIEVMDMTRPSVLTVSDVSSVVDGKKNFKKFKKVKPLKPQSHMINPNELLLVIPGVKEAIAQMDLTSSNISGISNEPPRRKNFAF